jgi:hypothetical protein
MIEFMHDRGFMTHMPFLAPLSSGGRILFFCCSDETRIWKLVYEENNDYFRIETGLPEDTIECSPTAWHDDEGWHISFIGGFTPECRDYFLYRMDGTDLRRMAPARQVQMASVGFVYKNRIVYGDQNKIVFKEEKRTIIIDVPDSYLYRISYCPDNPDLLLASVHNRVTKNVYLLEHDLKTGIQNKIECDGVAAYKCAILGNEMVYANRTGNRFEQRQVTVAHDVKRTYLRTVGEVLT